MIDVHCMVTSRDMKYFDSLLNSVKKEPINLYIFEGVAGHIGKGRAEGFSYGNSEYVGWVDPDDTIVPGAFMECLDYLTANPNVDGVYMYERVIFNGVVHHINTFPHHLTIIKRKIVEPLLPLIRKDWMNPQRYINQLKTLNCIKKVGYNFFIRNDSFTNTIAKLRR